MGKPKVYFPNLSGLRFIAASLVIVHHIEQLKWRLGLASYWQQVPFIEVVGKLGVILFFVLSGFLITYLLLVEESAHGKINLPKFYIRRVLRIWPLYFLIIFLAFFILPYIHVLTLPGYAISSIHHNLAGKLLLYGAFLSNLVIPIYGVVPYASHAWSIGTEEQFYLLWPIFLRFIRKYRAWFMFGIIITYVCITEYILPQYGDMIPYPREVTIFLDAFNIDCMAIGGLFALMLFHKHTFLKVFLNNYIFYPTLMVTSVLIAYGFEFEKFHYEIYAVLFGIIILNFAANKKIHFSLENRVLNYLGNISYGVYMYHPMAIILALQVAIAMHVTTNWFTYPLSFAVTIGIAMLSYRYFESYFLKFKDSFALITKDR